MHSGAQPSANGHSHAVRDRGRVDAGDRIRRLGLGDNMAAPVHGANGDGADPVPTTPATNGAPLSVIRDGIPAELRADRQWVLWLQEVRGEDKPTKLPYQTNGRLAEANDPVTWTTFDAVYDAYRRGGYSGVGYVFAPGAGLVGIDLDHCRDPHTGAIEPWAQAIIDDAQTYTEVSPSGTGVKLWCRGNLDGWPLNGKKTGKRKSYKSGAVEVYQHGRYFAVTGHKLPGTPDTINDCQALIDRLWVEIFAPPAKGMGVDAGQRAARRDAAAVMDRARAYVATMPAAISGQGGHNQTYAVACVLVLRFGLSRDEAMTVLREYNGRCQPPWTEAELDHKVDSADNQPGPRGDLRDAAPVPVVTGDGAAEAPPWVPCGQTDVANARRLVALHGLGIRYCAPWGKWLIWDGARWAVDDRHAIDKLAKDVGGGLWRLIASEGGGLKPDQIATAIKWAKYTDSARGIADMIRLARSEPGIAVRPGVLDADPWLLNCSNGTLDLRTGVLRPHDRADMLTKLCPTAYTPDAVCPTWRTFLLKIFAGDTVMIGFLRRLAGYWITGVVREHILPIAHGSGANGKTTFTNALLGVLGPDYAMKADKNVLVAKQHEGHSTERMDFFGKRFAVASETGDGQRLDEAMVKELTGGDPIRGRRMREDAWEYLPTHKIILATNHKPIIRGTDRAIWRRVCLIPFTVTIAEADQDKDLSDKLRAEAPGILAWAVRGCLAWQRDGLGTPAVVTAATGNYRAEQDLLAQWLDERCVVAQDARAPAAGLYADYRVWCEAAGHKPGTKTWLTQRLAERGHGLDKGRRWYGGIGIAVCGSTSE